MLIATRRKDGAQPRMIFAYPTSAAIGRPKRRVRPMPYSRSDIDASHRGRPRKRTTWRVRRIDIEDTGP